jgi:hypothetical protein
MLLRVEEFKGFYEEGFYEEFGSEGVAGERPTLIHGAAAPHAGTDV